MSSIPTKQIDGDVAVGRNVSAGGKATIRGSVTIGHNLKVDGWLDAPNIKGTNKGLFESFDTLNATYPNPGNGWWAIVSNENPDPTKYMGRVYYAYGGDWIGAKNSDGTLRYGGNPELDTSSFAEYAYEAAMAGITLRFNGFTDSQSKPSGSATRGGEVLFSNVDKRFVYRLGQEIYSSWSVDGWAADDAYNPDMESPGKDRIYIFGDALYIWSEEEGNLVECASIDALKKLESCYDDLQETYPYIKLKVNDHNELIASIGQHVATLNTKTSELSDKVDKLETVDADSFQASIDTLGDNLDSLSEWNAGEHRTIKANIKTLMDDYNTHKERAEQFFTNSGNTFNQISARLDECDNRAETLQNLIEAVIQHQGEYEALCDEYQASTQCLFDNLESVNNRLVSLQEQVGDYKIATAEDDEVSNVANTYIDSLMLPILPTEVSPTQPLNEEL